MPTATDLRIFYKDKVMERITERNFEMMSGKYQKEHLADLHHETPVKSTDVLLQALFGERSDLSRQYDRAFQGTRNRPR